MFSYFKRRKAQKECDAFNAANPVGTRVIIVNSERRWETPGATADHFTYDLAKVDANVAVVMLVGEYDWFPLDRLIVMPKRVLSPYSAKPVNIPLPTNYKRKEEPAPIPNYYGIDEPLSPAWTPPPSTSSFTDDFSSASYSYGSHRAPESAIVSGGGGNFGGGGASSSWSDSDSGSSSSSDSSSSSSND